MYSFSVTTALRGFRIYKDATIGEVLSCERDIGNSHDTFAVAIWSRSQILVIDLFDFYMKRWRDSM